jgi:hypothetical protein
MATLLQDDFDRANNTTSPGSPLVGGPYTVSSGTWGINSNQLYLSNTTTPAHYMLAPGAADVDFTYTQVLAQAGSSGPHTGGVIRAADASNSIYVARSTTGSFQIFQSIAGTGTALTPEIASVAGDVHRFIAYKEEVWFYVNGILRAYLIDYRYDPVNRTKIGFRNGQTTTGRWDNVLAVDVTAAPNTWGASPEAFDDIDLDIDAEFSLTPSLYKGRDTAIADESEIP